MNLTLDPVTNRKNSSPERSLRLLGDTEPGTVDRPERRRFRSRMPVDRPLRRAEKGALGRLSRLARSLGARLVKQPALIPLLPAGGPLGDAALRRGTRRLDSPTPPLTHRFGSAGRGLRSTQTDRFRAA